MMMSLRLVMKERGKSGIKCGESDVDVDLNSCEKSASCYSIQPISDTSNSHANCLPCPDNHDRSHVHIAAQDMQSVSGNDDGITHSHASTSSTSIIIGTNKSANNTNKADKLKECLTSSISDKSKKRISAILHETNQLTDVEKILLYLQLPNGSSSQDNEAHKQKGQSNAFGKKADIEVSQTYNWIKSHLEEDPSVSLPKHEVYDEYTAFSHDNKFEPLCVADFGKAMKSIFPKVKPRRLGQRGNSKYCYSGLRKKMNVETPELPVLDTSISDNDSHNGFDVNARNKNHLHEKVCSNQDSLSSAASQLVIQWSKKVLSVDSLHSIEEVARYLIDEHIVDVNCSAAKIITSISGGKQAGVDDNMLSSRIQLHKKLQEKGKMKDKVDQMKQTNKNNTTRKTNVNVNKGNKKNVRKVYSQNDNKYDDLKTVNEDDGEEKIGNSDRCIVSVKKEPTSQNESVLKQTGGINYCNGNKNVTQSKVAIPRSTTPTSLALQCPVNVNHNHSQPAIFLLPTVSSSHSLNVSCSSSLIPSSNSHISFPIRSSTSPIKSHVNTLTSTIPSKYKKIQPKPVTVLNRCDSETAVPSMSYDVNLMTKRRHSVSAPFEMDSNGVRVKNHLLTHNELSIQMKRHMDDKDIDCESSQMIGNKKRMLDYLSANRITDINHAFLSPSEEMNSNTSFTCRSTDGTEIGIQEIESDALMDYLNSTSLVSDDSINNRDNSNNYPIERDLMVNKIDDKNNDQISQLRKLLEKNLPQTQVKPLEGFSELREALLRKNLNNNVQCTMSGIETFCGDNNDHDKPVQQFEPSLDQLEGNISSPLMNTSDESPQVHLLSNSNKYMHAQDQVSSVPASPNARRRAFNFQPISPRNTPTLSDNMAMNSMNCVPHNVGNNQAYSSPFYIDQDSQRDTMIPVVHSSPRASKPPSETNSPFVSPRSTPTQIPPSLCLSRSRNNSGQSLSYLSRQTPYSNQNFDSGVSSISNSPFISPQTTPVPMSLRSRACTANGISMNQETLKVRHRSGPGGPSSVSTKIAASFLSHRSNSLSPMIGFNDGHHALYQVPTNQLCISNLANNFGYKTQHNQPQAIDSSCLSSVEANHTVDSTSSTRKDSYPNQSTFELSNNNNVLQSTPFCDEVNLRHRHVSNPAYMNMPSSVTLTPSTPSTPSCDQQFSPEISTYFKNEDSFTDSLNLASKNMFLNRSRSVPVHEMVFYHKKMNHELQSTSGSFCDDSVSYLDDSVSQSLSKSYPATPVCANQNNFSFPPSPVSSSKHNVNSLDEHDETSLSGRVNVTHNVLQSGQDVMVSGLQLEHSSEWTANHEDAHELVMTSCGARRNLSQLLVDDEHHIQEPEHDENRADDLQNTIDDLADIIISDDYNNDYSYNKLTQELEVPSDLLDQVGDLDSSLSSH